MNILLVDDHPMIVEGYKNVLLNSDLANQNPVFTTAFSCDDAYKAIVDQIPYNLAIIDKSLPGSTQHSLTSGSDIAMLIQKNMPNCKIIMITAHFEVVVIYEIVKKVKPDGLVIKCEVDPENLPQIVNEVLQGNLFQSPMVKSCIQEIWKKDLMIDDYNRQILMYLSKGFKIRELDNFINLTTSTIQKRIIQMKKAFDVSDDTGLVKEAIIQGFI